MFSKPKRLLPPALTAIAPGNSGGVPSVWRKRNVQSPNGVAIENARIDPESVLKVWMSSIGVPTPSGCFDKKRDARPGFLAETSLRSAGSLHTTLMLPAVKHADF